MAASRNTASLFMPAKTLSKAFLEEKFKTLLLALDAQEYDTVKKIVNDYPQVLSVHDHLDNTIFHYALTLKADEITRFFIRKMKFIDPLTLQNLLRKKNNNGLNCLHLAATFTDHKTTKLVIESLGDAAPACVRDVSNYGNIPIQLIFNNDLMDTDPEDAKKTYDMLDQLLFDYTPLKPIHNLLSFEKVLWENLNHLFDKEILNAELIQNLFYATIANNYARKIFAMSETHPDSNNLSEEDFTQLKNTINHFRTKYQFVKKNRNDSNLDEFFERLDRFMEAAKTASAGNCYEYSCAVLYALKNMGIKTHANLFKIANGDHIFVVLGLDENAVDDDLKSWGKNAVVIDAWAGEVYPAAKIFTKLHDCHHYSVWTQDDHTCSVVPVNPHYHSIGQKNVLGVMLKATDIPDRAALNPDVFQAKEASRLLNRDAILSQIHEQLLSSLTSQPEANIASKPRSNLN